MFEKLVSVESKYEQMMAEMADPAVQADNAKFRSHSKALSDLQPLVDKFREYKDVLAKIAATEEMLKDPDMRELAQDEMTELESRRDALLAEIKILLVPKDPNDAKNIILEIRAGTGGDEAALFAADLFRMYNRYAERNGWKVELLSMSESGVGGIKEVIAHHRRQERLQPAEVRERRAPRAARARRPRRAAASTPRPRRSRCCPRPRKSTSTSRRRTCASTRSARAAPAARASTPPTRRCGSRTFPTGIVVSQQDEKSQIKNRAKAMKVLRSRLYEMELQKQQDAIAKDRRSQVGTGERSEKIRTYNFKENRVTDHRIGLTMHQLDAALDGDLDQLIDAATTHFTSEKLKDVTTTDPSSDDDR